MLVSAAVMPECGNIYYICVKLTGWRDSPAAFMRLMGRYYQLSSLCLSGLFMRLNWELIQLAEPLLLLVG